MMTSIDGFISTADGVVNPQAQWDREMQQFYLDLFTVSGGAVFGCNLYEQYVGHWSRVAAGQLPPQTEFELRRGNHLFSQISEPVTLTFERVVPFTAGVNLHYCRPAIS